MDYRQYKTPYFEIEIGDSSAKNNLMKLPPHIHRLIQKVEILETLQQDSYTAITIQFIEGSREPASTDASLGTKGLYQVTTDGSNIDMNIAGSITNRPGALMDLRFNKNGLTWLSSTEQKSGKVDNSPQQNVNEQIVTRQHKNEHSNITFLLQERNLVKVTWGYKETPHKTRSIMGYIATIAVNFTDNGATLTTITCLPARAFLDILAPSKGIKFGTRTVVKGNSVVDFDDYEPEKLLHSIVDNLGIPALISTNLLGPKLDNGKQKMWIAGQSFKQFMDKLAEEHDAYWDIIPDSKTGVDTLYFIKRSDLESKLVIDDRSLTTYKAPGTLLRSVNITADFTAIVGSMLKNVGPDGQHAGVSNDITQEARLFEASNGKKETVAPVHPVNSGNPISSVKAIHDTLGNKQMVGRVGINPTSLQSRFDGLTQSDTDQNDRVIELEFTMVGYPFITPGVVEFRNIGLRYSGKYRVISVTHTIEPQSYTIKGNATTFSLAYGGVTTEGPKGQEAADVQIGVGLFQPAPVQTTSNSANDLANKYFKLKGIPTK